jgi:hypothetical protein
LKFLADFSFGLCFCGITEIRRERREKRVKN